MARGKEALFRKRRRKWRRVNDGEGPAHSGIAHWLPGLTMPHIDELQILGHQKSNII